MHAGIGECSFWTHSNKSVLHSFPQMSPDPMHGTGRRWSKKHPDSWALLSLPSVLTSGPDTPAAPHHYLARGPAARLQTKTLQIPVRRVLSPHFPENAMGLSAFPVTPFLPVHLHAACSPPPWCFWLTCWSLSPNLLCLLVLRVPLGDICH